MRAVFRGEILGWEVNMDHVAIGHSEGEGVGGESILQSEWEGPLKHYSYT